MKQQKEPLVTVVTITFNLIKFGREKYFRQCLESVHSQSYKNIEHIIVDGNSKDGSIELIKEYAKKGWINYISEPDQGVYDAMNKGIKLAKGKYITFLNSDDFYHNPDAVKLSVDALESKNADYSFADTQGVDEKKGSRLDVWKGNINRIPFGNHYCHQSMFVRTDVLRETGNFDSSLRISADSDLMVRLVALRKNYVYVPDSIVSYRGGGLSNEHIAETRKEHSAVFYKYLGKAAGLTKKDCFMLWNFSVLRECSPIAAFRLGWKIKKPEWRNEFFNQLLSVYYVKVQVKRLIYLIPWSIRKPLIVLYKKIRAL